MQLSLVIPIFNEVDILPVMRDRIIDLAKDLESKFGISPNQFECIWVDDGSSDGSSKLMQNICKIHPLFKVIHLSRNHGHQTAISAGIDMALGQVVVIMDGDLQDPPEFILDLYNTFLHGYDVVYAVREQRAGETLFKKTSAALFYKLLKMLTKTDIPVNTGDFRLMSRRVVDVLKTMREHHRFMRGMVSWVGFKQTGLLYKRDARYAGVTKYPLSKMIRLALDGLTSFSTVPLRFISYLGMATACLGFIYSFYIVYLKLFTHTTIPGWSSLIIVVLFLGGIQLLALGIIGEYLARVHDETKNRPLYIIESIYPPK
jgi:glycosyltransferase involved in cell wall biosynthesis